MRWFDRVLVVALAGGLWASVALQLFGVSAQAFSMDDILDEVLDEVEDECSVYGEVQMHSPEHGDIVYGYISC